MPAVTSLDKIRDVLLGGRYQSSPARTVEIPKASGTGTRTLSVPTVADGVVERAVVTVLQPLIAPTFSVNSFGGRPGKSTTHAIARAYALARGAGRRRTCGRRSTLSPPAGLLAFVRARLGATPVAALVETIVTANRTIGLAQGGPLSSLLLNLYLDAVLDRPWERDHPDVPLIRYVDDVLIRTIPCP